MRHQKTRLIASLALIVIAITAVGCGQLNFNDFMQCPSTPISSDGDLTWTDQINNPPAYTVVGQPRPGDSLNMMADITNTLSPIGTGEAIQFASNMRLWMDMVAAAADDPANPGQFVAYDRYLTRIEFNNTVNGPFRTSDVVTANNGAAGVVMLTNGTSYVEVRETTGGWAAATTFQAAAAPMPSGTITNVTVGASIDPDAGGGTVDLLPDGTSLGGAAGANDTFDAGDWFCGEQVVQGLQAGSRTILNSAFTIPWDQELWPTIIPNPGNPSFIGFSYYIFRVHCVLDPQNCVIERDFPVGGAVEGEANNHSIMTNAGDVSDVITDLVTRGVLPGPATMYMVVYNPNLPNLSIKFISKNPSTPLPLNGGNIITRWEILNSGIGEIPASQTWSVAVYISEDGFFDGQAFDPRVDDGNANFTGNAQGGAFPGNQNIQVDVTVTIPYIQTRANVYSNYFTRETTASNPVPRFGNPPPPPPNCSIYASIPSNQTDTSGSFLLAEVDINDEVREGSENDNLSELFGNGSMESEVPAGAPTGPQDLKMNSITVQSVPQGVGFRFENLILNYDCSFAGGTSVSIGYHLSRDDKAQVADWFLERFDYTVSNGVGQLLNVVLSGGGGINNNAFSTPNVVPPISGNYNLVVVLDDIHALVETFEDNNYSITGSTPIQF